jgi:transposase
LVSSEVLVGLPGYEVTGMEEVGGKLRFSVRTTLDIRCPRCDGKDLRQKDRRTRFVRHDSVGQRRCELALETRKWLCKGCGRSFWQRFAGILPGKRATEPYRRSVFQRHWDGICRSRLSEREGIGGATVERWFQDHLRRKAAERSNAPCPKVLGIDEHFFSRRQGYATTFCDLARHKVYDVVLGRSEASLEGYLSRLKGKEQVQVVCMDLSVTYRAVVRKHFPNARIVADRFHVIRLVNHQFLACWRQIDPVGSKNRGLLSLMRRHACNLKPDQAERLSAYLCEHSALYEIYRFKQALCDLLLLKHRTHRQCRPLVGRFLKAVRRLQDSKLAPLVQLGETLEAWSEEIVTMWRFTKNNGITEGFHNKMETLARQAYGFKNFENYRLRVKVMCS